MTALLVIAIPASLFAKYLVGQSIMLLSLSLADGGLATVARIIASKERPDGVLIAALQRVLNRYTALLAGVAFLVITVIITVLSRFNQTREVHVPTSTLLIFAAIGFIQARQTLWAGLIYSGGQFRAYSTAVLLPAVTRMVCVSVLIGMRVNIALPMLIAIDLCSSLIAWLYSSLWLQRLRRKVSFRGSATSVPAMGEQVHKILRSGMLPTFLEAVAVQSPVLAGSAFGSGLSVAAFGIFLRLVQVLKVVVDPLIIYAERRVRLASAAGRRRAEAYFFGVVGGAYIVMASSILLVYIAASALFKHYALGHSTELAVCLAFNLVGFMYLCLDSILLSRGYANFRLIGTLLQVSAMLLLLTILHPASLWQLVLLNGMITVPRFAFYAWFYLRRWSERVVWTLWVQEAPVLPNDRLR
ncbi:MAG: hypothetical protein JO266_23050 [Acidobacteria bacterium]|nr:hypothetical protein [Acidobacteriota bacterium]